MIVPALILLLAVGPWKLATPATAQTAEPSPLSGVSASPALAPLDALAIYDRARATVAARTLPPFIAYTEYAAFIRHGKVQAQHDRIVIRTADGKVNDTPIPDSPRDRIDTTPAVKDRPLVYPTTTFGLVKRRAGEQPSAYETASTPAPEASGPPVIGHVVSISRDYDPSLIGVEVVAGAPAYHLKLAPRFDPQHHPIRDLYVDTTTFDPRRIAIEVWAEAGPVRSRPTVTVDFAPVDGVWVIAHASMDFVLRLAFFNYGGSGEYRTSDFSFPPSEPDWMFDKTLLAEHLKNNPPVQTAPRSGSHR
jgi:hypothetical protein